MVDEIIFDVGTKVDRLKDVEGIRELAIDSVVEEIKVDTRTIITVVFNVFW